MAVVGTGCKVGQVHEQKQPPGKQSTRARLFSRAPGATPISECTRKWTSMGARGKSDRLHTARVHPMSDVLEPCMQTQNMQRCTHKEAEANKTH